MKHPSLNPDFARNFVLLGEVPKMSKTVGAGAAC